MKKIVILVISLLPVLSFAQDIGNYLITSDIGEYVFRPKRVITIGNAGVLVPTGHFPGHGDMTYEGIYIHPQTYLGVTVQLTQHSGSDSDKWLLHEVEKGFLKTKELGAAHVLPNPLRDINGNKIYYTWGYYRWISNYVVVSIQFTDLTGTRPEPLEVVQAYLQKFPSTIPATLILDAAHKIQWIKDEMDRRLWLCDKWFMRLQLKKAEEKDVYRESVRSMNVFLDYRETYYKIGAKGDKNLLASYLDTNNGTGIKAKLMEYKNWWTVNKDKPISL